MNKGKEFEHQFKISLEKQGFYVLRLSDPPQSFSMMDKQLRFSNKNPYDFQVFKNGKLYCLELKSTASTSFSIQFSKGEKGKDIKTHQIEGLLNSSKYKDVTSGFILNFRKTNNTYFLEINNFIGFEAITSKKSINESDVIKYHGILIPQEKLRVKYIYDFESIEKELF